jgi:hypothetical protein
MSDYTSMIWCSGLPASAGGKMPVEVLNLIMEYLPLESRVAWTLTCKHFKSLLGTHHFADIDSKEKKLAVLDVLARDLPNAIVCPICRRFHYMENIARYLHCTYDKHDEKYLPYYHMTYPACLHEDFFLHTRLLNKNIGATAFRMVVKRYEQQPECTELLKAISSPFLRAMGREKHVFISTEEFRIVQGDLILRKQTLFLPRSLKIRMLDYVYNPPEGNICRHQRIAGSWRHVEVWPMKCNRCFTEYKLDFKYNKTGYGMFLTTWKSLGTSPNHDKWQEHLNTGIAIRRGPHQRGDICAAFGDAVDFQFDSVIGKDDQTRLFKTHLNKDEADVEEEKEAQAIERF